MPAVSDETFDELAEHDGWAIAGEMLATFRPVDAGWAAKVHYRTVHGKYHQRWHVAVCDPQGTCKDVTIRSRLADARFYAEGRIRAENRPRAA